MIPYKRVSLNELANNRRIALLIHCKKSILLSRSSCTGFMFGGQFQLNFDKSDARDVRNVYLACSSQQLYHEI